MIGIFLSHAYKRMTRSVSFEKEMATTVFLGLITIMAVVYALLLGLALEKILEKSLGVSDSVSFLNGLLLYYFTSEFLIRYFMQNLPVLEVQPYLHLPIRKSAIVHFLLGKSLVHILNVFVFLLFLPFALSVVVRDYGIVNALSWILSIWLFSLSVHFIMILFKKKLDDTLWGLATIVLVFGLFAAADYFGWFKLSEVSAALFNLTVTWSLFPVVLFLVLAGLYYGLYSYFLSSFYPEDLSVSKEKSFVHSSDLTILKRFGIMGGWINVELKLILRNKRTRTILVLGALLLLYGLIFYPEETYTETMPGFLVFVGIFITGIFMINYGQFLFSWQGGHYDFTLTQPVSMRQYVESKYWLISSVTIACFLLSIPYVYFGWRFLFLHLACTLFNIGINSFIIMNMAMWDPKKVDLTRSSAFNYQGVGAAQWLMGFPILLSPYIFYLPLSYLGYSNFGLVAVGLAGLIGFTMHPYLIDFTTRRLIKKKYLMASNFRSE
ncbi:MAG: hypothetical protein HC811_03725 [Flammeovirgaceae bacterium]|nr:hypothetical protein [Flammeovirgaceae bacterium]